MAQKKKGSKSAKGGRPAVLSLGKKASKGAMRGKKVRTGGRSAARRVTKSGKGAKVAYKSRRSYR